MCCVSYHLTFNSTWYNVIRHSIFLQVSLPGLVMIICLLLFILQLPASEFDLLLLNTKNQIQLLTSSALTLRTCTVASWSTLDSGVLYVCVVVSGIAVVSPATSWNCWKEDFILLTFFRIRLARSILMYEGMICAVLYIGVHKQLQIGAKDDIIKLVCYRQWGRWWICQNMVAVDVIPEFVCQDMCVLVDCTASCIAIQSNINVQGVFFIMSMSTAVVVVAFWHIKPEVPGSVESPFFLCISFFLIQ